MWLVDVLQVHLYVPLITPIFAILVENLNIFTFDTETHLLT